MMKNLSSSLKSSLESLKNNDTLNQIQERVAQWQKGQPEPVMPEPAWSYLKGDYFQAPKGWQFNSSDLYPYYRMFFYGCLLLLFVLFLLLSSVFQGTNQKEAKAFHQTVQALEQPERFNEVVNGYLTKYPQGQYRAQVVLLQANMAQLKFLQTLNQAQRQPSLPLKLQAYQTLLKQKQFPSSEAQKSLEEKIATYGKLVSSYEEQLAKARTYSQKEYFTSSLLLLSKLVKAGPQYGHLYTEAQDLLNRTSAKKIDYFLVKGQLRKAKIALRDAQIHGVSSDVIDALAKKIKSLEQLKPLR